MVERGGLEVERGGGGVDAPEGGWWWLRSFERRTFPGLRLWRCHLGTRAVGASLHELDPPTPSLSGWCLPNPDTKLQPSLTRHDVTLVSAAATVLRTPVSGLLNAKNRHAWAMPLRATNFYGRGKRKEPNFYGLSHKNRGREFQESSFDSKPDSRRMRSRIF